MVSKITESDSQPHTVMFTTNICPHVSDARMSRMHVVKAEITFSLLSM